MRIGLIGAGRIGALHASTLDSLPSVTGVVISDVDHERARVLADKVGAAAASIDDLLSAVDGVVVATNTETHRELIERAAAAGLPVFCEKPVAPDVAGTLSALAAVRAAGVPLQVGFQRRHDAGISAVRRAVTAGDLGTLHLVRSATHDPAPPPAGYVSTSGGIFRDCAVHDFDAVRWVTGREVVEVSAAGSNRGDAFFAAAGDVDTAVATLTLDDGTLAVCTATRYNGAGYDVRLEAHGSAGALTAGLDEHAPLPPMATGQPYAGFGERFRDAYAAELIAFVDLVAGRRPNTCPGEEALAALLVAEAADLSRRENRPVKLTEVAP
ncbi:myo-inositol 2-dehydrogenase/D-chiro-inositol 1-dehydrogenase [Asanoa ferruginea]|uniref:Myo-inositol 2-dehydrogenase/D-chiro-inositol 1-dehydrogenase n=1 Tax=Asanoa ferruginea TaxID=53367 RepID=A0A3D9ZTY4_9ACTN|nr:Gfo/Idh/MocA family oxidoreductase [Asanoa ferruginea]REF99922.1 myo-inositol 2-dehydrogenase/D-chiro-inositol 1-dehydrogenase [Asanoa ferruginea]GIF51615.1 myo-inositol 2-dehydrogenase [Asanoa ferruginea]